VSSDSSENDDLVVKNAEYRATPSVQYYVILQQTRIAAIVFSRKAADWVTTLLTDGANTIDLPDIGVTIPLADLYTGLDLDGGAAAAQ
jgi:Uma2 family endonuclease